MEQQHIILESFGPHHQLMVVIPLSAPLLAMLQRRADMCKRLKAEDEALHDLSFGFFNFEVYEGEDPEELGLGRVDTIPADDLSDPERVDFGALVVGEEGFRLRFGIHHEHEVYETQFFKLKDIASKVAA